MCIRDRPDVNAELRTDVKFDELADADHHTGISPLKELSIGMVTQFPLDYMHLMCLGSCVNYCFCG